MKHAKQNFRLSSICLAVMAATSMGAFAQQEDTSTDKTNDEFEVIEITGIKGSLKKSINDKRFASGIRDTINAEDIGKSTDQNIADALGRVTGVTVVSADGEGTQITVRGANANQNAITLNGQTLTSTDFSQAVDLSSFSADTLSKLEVIKTSSADHDEGSLGASVNLVTVRPLDVSKDVRTATVQGRYSDFSEEANHKFQFSVSEKFLDETLGVALTVVDETNAYRRDQYSADNFQATPTLRQGIDQNGNVISNFRAIEPANTNYELHENESNRQGLSLGVQFLPTDTSELMFDVNYSKQDLVRTMDSIQARANANKLNQIEGLPSADNRPVAPSTDPYDWYQVNTDTSTMMKRMNRYGSGNMARSDGGTDNENFSTTLNFKTELTDSLRMSALVGMSKSTSDSKPDNAFTVMQNWAEVPQGLLYDAGDDIQPVGYDCTTGVTCTMIHGEGLIDFGANLDDYIDEDGVLRPQNWDNSGLTGFNPADTKTFFLGYIRETDVTVEDEIKNAQIDFDYDLDTFGITSVEFGAKVSTRTKFVDNQSYDYTSVAEGSVVEQPDGSLVTIVSGSMMDITGDIIAGKPMEYDNFMDSLGYARSSATGGWAPIDIRKAREQLLGADDLVRDVDNTETRSADIDSSAAYLKFNFELMDGALTGDIGVRYVKTDVEARGYNGFSFYADPNRPQFEFDFNRVTLRDLRNTDLPECRAFTPSIEGGGYNNKYQRVDGLGWDTNAGGDPSTWVRIPDQGPCHDLEYSAFSQAAAAFAADETSTLNQPLPGDYGVDWFNMWMHTDVRGSRFYAFDELPTWDGGFAANDTTPYDTITDNKSLKSSPTQGTHSYSNVLPSLNLNYAFSDEMIGRFAISKTMTRPEIDLLRPGYRVTEGGYWGSGSPQVGTVNSYNTQLEPLTSNNLDLSFEWYFSDTGMLSVALYRKDMSNFTERQSQNEYIVDVKEDGSNPAGLDELILTVDETDSASENYGLEGCLGLMATTDFGWRVTDATYMSNDLRDLCAQPSVTRTVNAEDATINGLEIGYVQTYDFVSEEFGLPEWANGFGLSANYTYQDSEYKSEITEAQPFSYPVADTPKHSYNASLFWEQDGHSVNLSFRGSSDSLVGRDWNTGLGGRFWRNGSIWNEGRQTLDLSANWQVAQNVSVSFQAINLTDEAYRTYFTSRNLLVVPDGSGGFGPLVEGNPLEGDAPQSRTYTRYKVGTTYRLGVRVNF
jgi:iron complex outermembrane receptor protein